MHPIQAFIFGIVEGLTEFLPISSTGHLMLTGRLMGLAQTDFLKTFEIAIQLGAILSVVLLYWRKLLVDFRVFKSVVVAFIPTAILGLVFYKAIKTYLLDSSAVVLWSLFIGGILLIGFEMFHRDTEEAEADVPYVPYKTSFLIGLFQSLAMIPGVSRSAATIVGGLALGLKRKTAVEFSFLLAIPTMAAATGLDLIKNAARFSPEQLGYLSIGFVTSFLCALAGIKFLLGFVKSHTFIPFGVYRIILVVIFWLFVIR